MKYQRRAALASLVLHGIFIGAVTGIAAFSVPAVRTLTIDFRIEKAAVVPAESPVPPPKPPPRQTKKTLPPPIENKEEVFPDTAVRDSTADTARFADSAAGEPAEQPVQVASAGAAIAVPDTGTIREKERQRYLKEQFQYIRDIIYRKAVYPPMAIEMNITGTVLLSFCVREDGSVGDIDLLKGSGASLLDRDAVSTIRRAAPFPRPPVRVTVKFPMEYRLE